METTPEEKLRLARNALADLFAGYKAEWLKEKLFHLFHEPVYLHQLQAVAPVILEGGRGTGKTTVLKCMEYTGQYQIRGLTPTQLSDIPYWGVYHKIDTSRVRAFDGPELAKLDWTRVFSHYLNLIFVDRLLQMIAWMENVAGKPMSATPSESFSASLGHRPFSSWRDAGELVRTGMGDIELYINNLNAKRQPLLTAPRRPYEELIRCIQDEPVFKGKLFFLLIDEYENLLDYQQAILNTYIKHCENPISFKVGVRPLGRRVSHTLNEDERLEYPADYALLRIEQELAETFAAHSLQIVDSRWSEAVKDLDGAIGGISQMLPSISLDDEAVALGSEACRQSLLSSSRRHRDRLSAMTPLEIAVVALLCDGNEREVDEVLAEQAKDARQWQDKLNNYGVAALFHLTSGKRGMVIKKYYAGVSVFAAMSGTNLRYFIELVHAALNQHFDAGSTFRQPVSAKAQTMAAVNVGRKILSEVDSVSSRGGDIKRLVLGLGRVFQVMAQEPAGHTPEVTSFSISDSPTEWSERISLVIRDAIAHIALRRFTGTKPTDAGDTRDDEYALHPVLSAFFGFSYRRKRKISLLSTELEGLISAPRKSIGTLLDRQGRVLADAPLSPQLNMFKGFYEADSG